MPANPAVLGRIASLILGTFVLAVTTSAWGQTAGSPCPSDMGDSMICPQRHTYASSPPPPPQEVGHPSITAGASIIYVDDDAPGANDGTSWADAYLYLQDALAAAAASGGAITEIRVAQGIYKPDRGVNRTLGDRTATFALLNGVALRGGYAGWGTPDPNARDITGNETILSGDLNGDDAPVACTQNSPDCDSFGGLCVDNVCIIKDGNTDNSYHVVIGTGTGATAVLDGFTITAGNANGSFPDIQGGEGAGMYNHTGSPTVSNCTFTGNWARVGEGGGMYNLGSNPTLTNCTFSGNSAGAQGGGMYNQDSNPTVTDCTFTGNSAYFRGYIGIGGGMFNYGSSPTVTNCTFSGNSATYGGGMYNNQSRSPTVSNCTFSGNSADDGGGMYNGGSSPMVTDCTFSGNSANDSGGGMYNKGSSSSPTVTNCTFSGNSADGNGGGGMSNWFESSPAVTNCTFSENSAGDGWFGGGMYNYYGSSPTVTDCTFSGNSAQFGGGMNNAVSSPAVTHCTFSGNFGYQGGGGMYNDVSSPTVTDCTFTGNRATSSYGGGMYNSLESSPAVTDCTFSGNLAYEGGGMSNYGGNPTVTNCTFSGNSAVYGGFGGGGGMSNYGGNPTVTNCTFSGNSADQGGGMSNVAGSPAVANCTFSRNSANSDGGGIYNGSSQTVINSILWGNVRDADGNGGGPFMDESAQIYTVSGTPVVNYSIVQGGWSGAGGIGVLDADPLFVDPDGADDMPGTEDDDLRLLPGSPAIDAGNNAAVPADLADVDHDGDFGERLPLDFDGHPRFVDDPEIADTGNGIPPVVDMGAFEFQPDCNQNGVSDALDVAHGTSPDCNGNNRPDECEIDGDSTAPGGPFFCTTNCDPDCNDSGVPDECEVPQIGDVVSVWVGGTGLWDEPPNESWCLPESPNNNPNAVFDVIVEGPTSVVTLNTSPSVNSLSLTGGATVVVSDAAGANVRTLHSDGDIINRGVFRATDRERLVLDALLIDQGGQCGVGGTLEATDGVLGEGEESDKSILEVNGARVLGGIARTQGQHSEIHLIGGAELVDVCVDGVVIPDGQTGAFSGTVTNDGIMSVRGKTFDTRLDPRSADAVLEGAGRVQLTSQSFSRLGDFKASFTNSKSHRIEGAGLVYGGMINNGTLSADLPGQHLILSPPGRKRNDGLFLATGGGTLRLADDVSGSGMYEAVGGAIVLAPSDEFVSVDGLAAKVRSDGSGASGTFTVGRDSALSLSDGIAVEPGGIFEVVGNGVVTTGSLTIDGSDAACPPSAVAGGPTPPVTNIRQTAQVQVLQNLVLIRSGATANTSSENVSLEGNWDNQGTCSALFDWTVGGLSLSGSGPQRFEVAGRDLGRSRMGFGSAADSNFSMGLVEVLPGRDVTFTDAFDNDGDGQPPCSEALYVHELTLGAGSAVTFDNCRVYYDLLIDEGATITRIGCGDLQPLPSGDTNGDRRVDLQEWDLLGACLHGPGSSTVSLDCAAFDFDADLDIDLADAAWFQRLFNGP